MLLEKQLLGCILLDNKLADKVVCELTEEHFVAYRQVFNAIKELTTQEKAIDVVSLSTLVEIKILSDIATSVVTSVEIDTYIKQLKEHKHRRDIKKFSEQLIQKAKDHNVSNIEIQNFIANAPTEEETGTKHQDLEKILQNVVNDVGARMKAKDDIRGLRTGFSKIDNINGGLKNTEIIALIANPNVGKSLLALNIACNVAKMGNRVDYFAYEMSNNQIGYRMLPSTTGVPIKAYSKPKQYMTNEYIKKIQQVDNKVMNENLNVYSDELKMNTVNEMNVCINKTTLKKNKQPSLIIIDYLQLLHSEKDEEWDAAGDNLKKVRGIAKKYNVPVLIIMSKAKDGSIRGSGQIEFDIDQKWNMKREHDATDETTRMATELIIGKNRDGGKGLINLIYDEEYLMFRE